LSPALAIAAEAPAGARPPYRWTNNTSAFVLRRISQLIQTRARADKGFKGKDVNQVVKVLKEYGGEDMSAT
jgi:hypothetical protein